MSNEHEERLKQIRERRNALQLRHGDWPYQTVHNSKERAFQQYVLADMDFLLSLLDSQVAVVNPSHDDTHEDDSALYCLTCSQQGYCGMCLRRDDLAPDERERVAIRMRDKSVEIVRAIHEERLRGLRELTEKGEVEHEDAEYERAVLLVLGNVIDAIQSLTLDNGEQEQK